MFYLFSNCLDAPAVGCCLGYKVSTLEYFVHLKNWIFVVMCRIESFHFFFKGSSYNFYYLQRARTRTRMTTTKRKIRCRHSQRQDSKVSAVLEVLPYD